MNDSENRDARRRAKFKGQIEVLVDRAPAAFARTYGLDQPAAPIKAPPPTPEAEKLGFILLEEAERRLATIFATHPAVSPLDSRESGEGVAYETPVVVERALQRIGIPLVLACCPQLVGRLAYQVAGHAVLQGKPDHPLLAAQLSQTFVAEYDLWMRAGYARIPYSFAYWALQHIRKARAKPGHASLCVRCGDPLLYYTRKRAVAAQRCRRCAKEPPAARTWPEHAVMPHTHATWWLKCQAAGCTSVFCGRRQAQRCPAHRSARLTPRRRASLVP